MTQVQRAQAKSNIRAFKTSLKAQPAFENPALALDTIRVGDCLKQLALLPDASVDLVFAQGQSDA